MVREDESDDDWNERVDAEGETRSIKILLDSKKLRDRTPLEPYWDTREGYTAFNLFVMRTRKSWRMKYYDEIRGGKSSEYRLDENGNKHKRMEWQPKPGAAETRRNCLNSSSLIHNI